MLAVADAKIFHKSYGDQTGELWSPSGTPARDHDADGLFQGLTVAAIMPSAQVERRVARDEAGVAGRGIGDGVLDLGLAVPVSENLVLPIRNDELRIRTCWYCAVEPLWYLTWARKPLTSEIVISNFWLLE